MLRRIFVGSVGPDLLDHRHAVCAAVDLLSGVRRLVTEDLPVNLVLERLTECDLFIGIVGHLYGDNMPGSSDSLTVHEYHLAEKHKKNRLIFVATEDLPSSVFTQSLEHTRLQQAFRRQLGGEDTIDTFADPQDLAQRVRQGIVNWMLQQPLERSGRSNSEVATMPFPPQPCFAHPYPLQATFTGRLRQRQLLTDWSANVLAPSTFILEAIGGMGKSALAWAWLQRDVLGLPLLSSENDTDVLEHPVTSQLRPDGVLWWSFYEKGARFDAFLRTSLIYCSGGNLNPDSSADVPSGIDGVRMLVDCLRRSRMLLVLDGFERELVAYSGLGAAYLRDDQVRDDSHLRSCIDPLAASFLQQIASVPLRGRVLLTSRLLPRELEGLAGCRHHRLEALDADDAVKLMRRLGVRGLRSELHLACEKLGFHPLSLRLLGGALAQDVEFAGHIRYAPEFKIGDAAKADTSLDSRKLLHILEFAYDRLSAAERTLISTIAAFRFPVSFGALLALSVASPGEDARTGEGGAKSPPTMATVRGILQSALSVVVVRPIGASQQKSSRNRLAANTLKQHLQSLLSRGFLLQVRETRLIDLHPAVRGYAYDRLGEKTNTHALLCDYFSGIPRPEQIERVDDLAPSIELYHHTVRAGRFDEAFKMYVERLAYHLYQRLGACGVCVDLLSALFPDGDNVSPRLKNPYEQAWATNALANVCSHVGDSQRALHLLDASVSLLRPLADKRGLIVTLESKSFNYLGCGELKAAREAIEMALKLAKEARFGGEQGTILLARSELLSLEGLVDEAEKNLLSAEDLFSTIGGEAGLAACAALRASHALRKKCFADAAILARKAIKLGGRVEINLVSAKRILGLALIETSSLEFDDGSLREAEQHLRDALRRCRDTRMVDHEADILLALAKLHRRKGNYRQARSLAVEGLEIADRCLYRLQQSDLHGFLARLCLDEGDVEAARSEANKARERALCCGSDYPYRGGLDEAAQLLSELDRISLAESSLNVQRHQQRASRRVGANSALPLRILHIADLHEKGPRELARHERERVLGRRFDDCLDKIRKAGTIDFVCFTGDAAHSGQEDEYRQITPFLERVLGRTGVSHDHLFLVPGNHDINQQGALDSWKKLREKSQNVEARTFSRWTAYGCPPIGGLDPCWRSDVLERGRAYREWLNKDLKLGSCLPASGTIGYRATLNIRPFPVHILGLDTAWLAGDGGDHEKLWLTEDQLMRVASDDGRLLPGIRIP